MPDKNQSLIVKVLLGVFVVMFLSNTLSQFLQISYKEPWYASTFLIPLLGAVVYAYYKRQPTNVKRILVVEDKAFWLSVIDFCLSQKYELIICKTAEEALEYLKHCKNYEIPDHCLIDNILPGMSGVDLIQQINKMGFVTRITVLSVEEPSDDRERQFADSWLLKVPESFRGGAPNLLSLIENNENKFSWRSLIKSGQKTLELKMNDMKKNRSK